MIDRLAFSAINYWVGFALDLSVSITVIVAGLAATHHPWPIAIAALLAGAIAFSFYEYALHRWLYHALPNPVRRIHAHHHADTTRLVGAPVLYTQAICALTWVLARAVVGAATGAVFAGTVLFGYAFYSAVHHVIHRRGFAGGWLARVQRHHLEHHRRPRMNFGVTTRIWDRLFGTHVKGSPASP